MALGQWGTRPRDGRNPTTPQKAAGFRNEPPMSLPSARGNIPLASATAAPPLLPPAVLSVFQGLSVVPNTLLNVWDPVPNSGVLVLPITRAPAAFRRCTRSESWVGTLSAKIGDPMVVRIPRVAERSLIAMGKPANGPGAAPE